MIESKPQLNTIIVVLLVALIAICCYLPSLNCYFFADDFLCIDYLYKIFHGHPALLFQRLFSPWQDNNVQLLYRPMGDISLALDYLIWQANAFGYHLSNILLHTLCTVLVFFLAKTIYSDLAEENKNANLTAFLASALFASYPLHTENVIWIVGRLDLLCTAFFLASFLSFIRYLATNKKGQICLSLLFYIFALMSKEVAIVLPVVFLAYLCLLNKEQNYKKTLLACLKLLVPYLLTSILFLGFRYLVLGSFIGGYAGSFAAFFKLSLARRLSDLTLYWSLLYPLNRDLTRPGGFADQILHSIYIVFGLFLLLRIPFCPWDGATLRRILFVIIWAVLGLLPALQNFGMNISLSGGRIVYLSSVPISLLFVLLLYPFASSKKEWSKPLIVGASTIILALVLVFSGISLRCHSPWLKASKLFLAIQQNVSSLLDKTPGPKKLLLMNVPTNLQGAHFIYEFPELKMLLSPPLCSKDYSARLSTADWFLSPSIINKDRVKRLVQSPEGLLVYSVNQKNGSLVESPEFESTVSKDYLLNSKCSYIPVSAKDDKPRTKSYLVFLKPAKRTKEIAFIDVVLRPSSPNTQSSWQELPEEMWLEFFDKKGNCSKLDKLAQKAFVGRELEKTYSFPVSECFAWDNNLLCNKFILSWTDKSKDFKLQELKLFGPGVYPTFEPDLNTIQEGNDGDCQFKNGKLGVINFDASSIPGATGVLIEISKPRYMFALFSNSWRSANEYGWDLHRQIVNKLAGAYSLRNEDFPESARYQVHVIAVNKQGQALGKFSYPLTFKINK